MIPRESVAAAALLALALAGCQDGPTSAVAHDQLHVTHVADGDTISGLDPTGQRVRVRLLGIDSPEVAHDGHPAECGATEARESLEQLVMNQDVTLVDDPRSDSVDRYGRRLAYVEIRDVDAALFQVRAGYAAAWYPRSEPKPARQASYEQAEHLAHKSRLGAWARCPTIGR